MINACSPSLMARQGLLLSCGSLTADNHPLGRRGRGLAWLDSSIAATCCGPVFTGSPRWADTLCLSQGVPKVPGLAGKIRHALPYIASTYPQAGLCCKIMQGLSSSAHERDLVPPHYTLQRAFQANSSAVARLRALVTLRACFSPSEGP